MDRRRFLRLGATMSAWGMMPGALGLSALAGTGCSRTATGGNIIQRGPLGNGPVSESDRRRLTFRRYRPGQTIGQVMVVTPDDGFYLHTFYDECPFSPSERYLCVNRIPYQGQFPKYGDLCDICLIDLQEETIETVYRTLGWGFQLGANLNWGATDRYLYTNDILNGQAVCVRMDLETREAQAFSGPMYDIEPNERSVVSFPLDLINDTQEGYGVPEYRERGGIRGAPKDQGLWRT
ncbi:MAG: hypothetical protein ACO37D_11285, partial [Rhodothermales bacterium]